MLHLVEFNKRTRRLIEHARFDDDSLDTATAMGESIMRHNKGIEMRVYLRGPGCSPTDKGRVIRRIYRRVITGKLVTA